MTGNLSDLGHGLNFPLGHWATRNVFRLPRAIAMTDTARAPDPARLLAGLPRHGALIVRHADPDRLAALARTAVPIARRLGHIVLVSGFPAIALTTGAHGVHLSEALLRRHPSARRVRFRPDWIITAAAHNVAAVGRAARAGVDAVLLSPVYPTASHPASHALGFTRFCALCHGATVPIYALGGVERTKLRRLKISGCHGVAGIGLFHNT